MVYGITIWGVVASPSVINQVQIVQNLTMRWILNLNKYTPVKSLLDKCDFLSVYQLTVYYTILQVWKLNVYGVSARLGEWVETNRESPIRTETTASVWSRIGPLLYSRLPVWIQSETKIGTFKRRLRCWIKKNIPLYKI